MTQILAAAGRVTFLSTEMINSEGSRLKAEDQEFCLALIKLEIRYPVEDAEEVTGHTDLRVSEIWCHKYKGH